MIKRVNFTGRRRIPRERVRIEVDDGPPRRFSAAIDLNGIDLLPNAAVVLEAMCAGSTVVERFKYGEVGNLLLQDRRVLRELDGEKVFFTLKVVDRTERFGRILGIAERIRPERAGKPTAAGRQGILPIDAKDLGEEIWQLHFGDHEVCLLVNDKIVGLLDRARSDPLFYAAVYPEVVRRVLAKALDEGGEIDEEDDGWPIMWQRFGKSLHPMRQNPPTGPDREDERDEWIEEVVKAFCGTHCLKSKYAAALAGASGGDS